MKRLISSFLQRGICMLLLALPAALLSAQTTYEIYPIPHQISYTSGNLRFTEEVEVICGEGIDQATKNRAEEVLKAHGLRANFIDASTGDPVSVLLLGINGEDSEANTMVDVFGLSREVFNVPDKFDRHLLHVRDNGEQIASTVILGEHTDAVFFALASLEQMLDKGTENLSGVTINDYADMQSRGLVEGYYGYPYSIEVKKDLMQFMKRYKMNTYLYGAKSDPYHSQYWKDPYPASITAEQEANGWLSQDMVKELAETSQATKVNFIWAIHPGNDFIYSSTVINDIMGKYEKMYNLGVRQFAVFVDDVGVPSSDADVQKNADQLTALQRAIEAKWNTAGAAAADTVRPLHFVPQIYCTGFASSTEQYNKFFQALATTPSYVTIYTTGAGVWSVPNETDFNAPRQPLGRKVAWWWNYPCNDNADGRIYPMDMYSNFIDLPSVWNNATLPSELIGGIGIVSNPMQQGEVAKTPLFSVADYVWNTAGFDNLTSYDASFKPIVPVTEAAREAYKYLAPYLRTNENSGLSTLISSYKSKGDPTELKERMTEIINQSAALKLLSSSENESERLLWNDLKPWALKLEAMAKLTYNLLDALAADEAQVETLASLCLEAKMMNDKAEYRVDALEGMGTAISVSNNATLPSQQYIAPFINYLVEKAGEKLEGNITDISAHKGITNQEGTLPRVSGVSILAVSATQRMLQPGKYMGIQLKLPTYVSKITVADTLYTNHTVLYSQNGKEWKKISANITEPSIPVRYVVVVNDTEAPKSLRLTTSSIKVTMPDAITIDATNSTIPDGNIWENHNKELMFDGDYTTFVCLNKNQSNNDAYTLKLNAEKTIKKVRIAMGTVNGDYMTEGKVQISTDNVNWTDLFVKGSLSTTYTLSLPQVVTYNDEVKLCDFSGGNQKARYVRLLLSKANTSKWIRLYEIEVNGSGTDSEGLATDDFDAPLPGIADPASLVKIGGGKSMTYHFIQPNFLDGFYLAANPEGMTGVTASVTSDGTNWTELPVQFASSVTYVDMTAHKDATALRLNWTGNAPSILDIFEVPNATESPEMTGIRDLTFSSASRPFLFVEGGLLKAVSDKGIASVEVFSMDGKKLSSRSGKGNHSVSVSLAGTKKQSVVVRARLTDGSSIASKILLP
ncbi:MAG: beta-N-acetylglucosaminidase domain-containing protein [Alloprevotella sp.]